MRTRHLVVSRPQPHPNLRVVSRRCAVVVGDAAGEVGKATEIVYTRIIPALGVALLIGNVYYAHMAIRMKTQFGRDFTAQPYGINTVGMYPTLFNIMLPVAISSGSFETAWKAGCTANFVVGLINIFIGVLFSIPWMGNAILKVVPIHALTVPVAGVGITWLGINQIAPCFGTPAAGFVPVFMIFLCYFAKSPLHIMGVKIPEAFHWVIPGMIAGYAYQLPAASQEGYKYEIPDGGLWIGSAFVEGFKEVGEYFGIVLPVAIGASASGLMALTSAWNAGDPYPIGETMITDGLFTAIGALFGSPMGTVIYFGHPIHKRIGGKTFFSFANGLIHII